MENALRGEIKHNLKDSIRNYVSEFKYKSKQPLDVLIPKERKIRSVVGGLETSMGTTVWEPIAETLARANGFEVIEEGILMPDPFPTELAGELPALIRLRESKNTWIPTGDCVRRLREVCREVDNSQAQYVQPPAGTGVDLRFSKGGKEYAFDTKTVQPNLGDIKKFNKQLLEWYAYSLYREPDLEIECKIAYPYNPYRNDFWAHAPHNSGVLEPQVDAVVENEFWDFISGLSNTWQQVVAILTELNEEGFGQELSDLIERIHTPLTS